MEAVGVEDVAAWEAGDAVAGGERGEADDAIGGGGGPVVGVAVGEDWVEVEAAVGGAWGAWEEEGAEMGEGRGDEGEEEEGKGIGGEVVELAL